ncbi:MAG TPA: hypothetical protein VGQ12_07665 [Candidatus Angelobacter sp.]|nr:hypothetical protein [Candidatus Angelobacter sp.]
MPLRWPWTSAARFDDMLREKNTQLGQRDKRIADLERETRRMHDLIYKANFGVQVFDTIPEVKPEPEVPLTPEQVFEQEIRNEEQRRKDRIAWTKRHRPSQLADVLAQEGQSEQVQAARAAHPVQQIFETARGQVIGKY